MEYTTSYFIPDEHYTAEDFKCVEIQVTRLAYLDTLVERTFTVSVNPVTLLSRVPCKSYVKGKCTSNFSFARYQ